MGDCIFRWVQRVAQRPVFKVTFLIIFFCFKSLIFGGFFCHVGQLCVLNSLPERGGVPRCNIPVGLISNIFLGSKFSLTAKPRKRCSHWGVRVVVVTR